MNYCDFGIIFNDGFSANVAKNLSDKYEMIGAVAYTSSRKRLYVVKCKDCSKDGELFGDGLFLTEGKKIQCGCCRVKWSNHQYETLVRRVFNKRNCKLIGFSDEKINNKTHVFGQCEKHGKFIVKGVSRVINAGTSCALCGLESLKGGRKTKDEFEIEIKNKINSLGISDCFIGFDNDNPTAKSKFTMKCNKHGYYKKIISSFISNGSKCNKCTAESASKLNSLTIDEIKEKVIASMNKKGVNDEIIRVIKGSSVDESYVIRDCVRHGEYKTRCLDAMYKKCTCPSCSFFNTKIAYINGVYDEDDIVCVKFGVTSDEEYRLYCQNLKSTFSIKNIKSFKFKDYKSCRSAENECKKTLPCGVISKKLMQDGYTETTSKSNVDKIIDIYIKHGGIEIV